MGTVKFPFKTPISHEKIKLESGKLLHVFKPEKTFQQVMTRAGINYLELEE